MNKIDKLIDDLLFESLLTGDVREDLMSRLYNFDQLYFISRFLVNGKVEYNNMFFLAYAKYWESLDISDWENLLIQVSNSSLGVFSFFNITYKYLEIDFFPYFTEIDTKDERKRRLVLKRFFENPHLLQHDNEAEKKLEFYSASSEVVEVIRLKLLSQGAFRAEVIEPRTENTLGYTQVPTPLSWYDWGRKYGFVS